MTLHFCHFLSGSDKELKVRFLLFLWITGFLLGIRVFSYLDSDLTDLMIQAAVGQVSVISVFCTAALPFFVSVFAVYSGRLPWLLGVCFLKAFLFGYISAGVLQCFGSAGWMVHGILMFSELFGNVILFSYWVHTIQGSKCFSAVSFLGYTFSYLLIAFADHYLAAPFLRSCII